MKKLYANFFVIAFAAAGVVFALNSYPMMRPGFDIWWHMAMAAAPQVADAQVFPASRLSWHYFWHHVLNAFEVTELFERALWIHRIQFLFTLLLITLSAYWVLRVLTSRIARNAYSPENEELWLAAIVSTLVWLLMHGTASTPHGGSAPLVASWMVWYSVNYQISLPLYFASIAALLYAVGTTKNKSEMVGWTIASIVFISVGTAFHAAETAYFIVCLALMAVSFIQGRKSALLLAAFASLGGVMLITALRQSYVTPELLNFISQGDVAALFHEAHDRGVLLIDRGAVRPDTSWNAFFVVCFVTLLIGVALLHCLQPSLGFCSALHGRATSFVILTALMPMGLLFTYSAGALAMLTHINIAWRFSLSSFLFLGPGFLAIAVCSATKVQSGLTRMFLIVILFTVCVGATLAWSYRWEPQQATYQFGRSLLNSLDPRKSYYRVDSDDLQKLDSLALFLRQSHRGDLLCADIFTSYYLFFLKGYHQVSLPRALAHIPGYSGTSKTCKYDPDNESLRSIRPALDLPSWTQRVAM